MANTSQHLIELLLRARDMGAEAELKSLNKNLDQVGRAVKAIGGAYILKRATQQIYEFAQSGARLIDLSNAFERLAERADTTGQQILSDAKAITGALSEREIMQSANMLELLGVGMENTARFIEIAKAAAIGLNKPLAQMLESIATGTARQSRLWLDNLGIIISVTDANKEYAKQLGITADKMTDMQQRAAFLSAVLERGNDIIKAVGSDARSMGEDVDALSASLTDLKDAASEVVAVPVAWWARNMASGIRAALDLIKDPSKANLYNFTSQGLIPNITRKPITPVSDEPGGVFGEILAREGRERRAELERIAADEAAAAAKAFFDELIKAGDQWQPDAGAFPGRIMEWAKMLSNRMREKIGGADEGEPVFNPFPSTDWLDTHLRAQSEYYLKFLTDLMEFTRAAGMFIAGAITGPIERAFVEILADGRGFKDAMRYFWADIAANAIAQMARMLAQWLAMVAAMKAVQLTLSLLGLPTPSFLMQSGGMIGPSASPGVVTSGVTGVDSVPALVGRGEAYLDHSLTDALREFLASGGGGQTVYVMKSYISSASLSDTVRMANALRRYDRNYEADYAGRIGAL